MTNRNSLGETYGLATKGFTEAILLRSPQQSDPMKTTLSIFLLLTTFLCTFDEKDLLAAEKELPSRFPEFNWEKIPLYMHLRKDKAYTEDEIQFLAKFPLITLEKANGHKTYGDVETGSLQAARAIKKINPKTKILYYRNILVHYQGYKANEQLKQTDKPFLSDAQGNTKLVHRGVREGYDLSNPAVQKWWLQHAKVMVQDPAIDGIFVDGNIKVLEPNYLKREIGEKKKKEVVRGYEKMMVALRKEIGDEKLILANILRARLPKAGLDYLQYFDGSYLECFELPIGTSREDYIAQGIAAAQKAARSGKVIALTCGLNPPKNSSQLGIDEGHAKAEANRRAIEKRLNYMLGVFLVIAEKGSYFRIHEGYAWDPDGRWRRWFSQYDRPLGKPRGPAKLHGYEYTRDFEYASVTVNIQNEEGEILWKKK